MMVRRLIKDGKRFGQRNGFTVMEILIVLLVVGVMMSLGHGRTPAASLNLFMKQLESAVLSEQFAAFESREKREVQINRSSFQGKETRFTYPGGITCSPLNLSYNARGNIAKAGSVNCSDGHHRAKMVFQIGAGRVRVERGS